MYYSDYLRSTLTAPVVRFIVAMAMLIFGAIVTVHTMRKKKLKWNFAADMALPFLICLLFFSVNLSVFLNGGRFLLHEKESDAQALCGTVESVTVPSNLLWGYKSGSYKGADVVIGGQRFFMIDAGKLKAGTKVQVSYLPESRFVLKVELTSEVTP